MELITVIAVRTKIKDGRYKGFNATTFFKNNKQFAYMPPEQRQPKFGSKTIILNCFRYNVEWAIVK